MREQSQLRVPVESCIVTRSDIRGCKKFGKPTRLEETTKTLPSISKPTTRSKARSSHVASLTILLTWH